MRTQFILIACLAIAKEIFGTQVYETPSYSSQQWQPLKNQDSIQAPNEEQEQDTSGPVTFDTSDTQQKESQSFYSANIQSSGSGVANVVGQQSVRILSSS